MIFSSEPVFAASVGLFQVLSGPKNGFSADISCLLHLFLIIHIQLTKLVSYCPLAFQLSTLLSFQPSSHLVFLPSIFCHPAFQQTSLLVYWHSSPLALLSSDFSSRIGFLLLFYSSISLHSRVLLLASLFFLKSRKVTFSDFRKKMFWPKNGLFGPKMAQIQGFWPFSRV